MAKSKGLSMDKEYQAKWDIDTLKQAKEIESDKARMMAAQNYAKKQVLMLGGIVSEGNKTPVKKTMSKKK